MKRTHLTLILMILSLMGVRAESIVHGQILEYDGTNKQKPIQNVEISVMGAGSAISDQDGKFVLKFRILEPGDKINVHRISKRGYEIFNQDVIDDWIIPSDNQEKLTIILCKTSTLDKLRQSYRNAAEKNILQLIVDQEKKYGKSLKNGLITQEEYNKKLKQVKESMENRLENADGFIEKFIHIDITKLNQQQRKIHTLVKKGKFEEAMSLYDKENLILKYTEQVENINRERQAQEKVQGALRTQKEQLNSIYATIKRHIELLHFTGGRDNIEKERELRASIAYSDTTNFRPLLEYAIFEYGQSKYKNAEEASAILGRNSMGKDSIIYLWSLVYTGASKRMQLKIEEAQIVLNEALQLSENLSSMDKIRSQALYHLAHTYRSLNQIDKALEFFMESRELQLKNLDKDPSTINYSDLAKVESFCGDMLDELKRKEEAEILYKKSVEHITVAYDNKPRHYKPLLAYCLHHLGWVYDDWKNEYLERAIEQYSIAEQIYREFAQSNPEAYNKFWAEILSDIGTCYYSHGRYTEAMEYLDKSDAVLKTMQEDKTYPERLYNYIVKINKEYRIMVEKALQEAGSPAASDVPTYVGTQQQ